MAAVRRERGFTLVVYALLALAVLGTLSGIAYKLNHDGYLRGKAEVKAEWDQANAAAQKLADADRERLDALRQAQDQGHIRRLANEKKRATAIWSSLEAHIKVAGLRNDCRVTPELLNDANSALSGVQGVSPGGVSGKPGTTTPAD